MNPNDLLPLLRDVAETAQLPIRRAPGMPSGVAVLKGKVTVAIEQGTPAAEECRLLLDALRRMDLGGIFLPPAVRDALERNLV